MRQFGIVPANKPIFPWHIDYKESVKKAGGKGTDDKGTEFTVTYEQIRQADFIKFNELIGLPKHPATGLPTPLMPWQIAFEYTTRTVRRHKFHVNKARQIGFTELTNRILAYNCFRKYVGRRILIIAGTREKTTKKIMARFQELFKNFEEGIVIDSNDLEMTLFNGTTVEGLPSSSESIRGDTQIGAIFMDEAAHYGLVDDSVVMDAVRPIVDTNKSDLFMVSTPNGPAGFFYELDVGQNDYHKEKFNIWVTEGWIYSHEEIVAILNQKDIDVEQEYLNQYTPARNSIFGSEITIGEHDVEDWGDHTLQGNNSIE
jgi:hypothetical protein